MEGNSHQAEINNHFIKMAEGERPIRKNGVILLSQIGRGPGTAELKIVSPSRDAVNQAKSDLKRGLDETDIFQDAIKQDVKRRKLSHSTKRKKKRTPNSSRNKKRSTRKGGKKKKKRSKKKLNKKKSAKKSKKSNRK